MTSKPTIRGLVNNRRDLVLAWEDRLEVYNLETQKLDRKVVLAKIQFQPSPSDLKVSQDGKRILTESTVWDGFSGDIIHNFKPNFFESYKNFLPRSNTILTRSTWIVGSKSYDGIRIFNIEKNEVVADLIGANSYPAISGDGRVMVSTVDRVNPELLVWDLTQLPK